MSRDFRHKVSGRERLSERDLSGSHESPFLDEMSMSGLATLHLLTRCKREQPGSGLISGVTHTGHGDM